MPDLGIGIEGRGIELDGSRYPILIVVSVDGYSILGDVNDLIQISVDVVGILVPLDAIIPYLAYSVKCIVLIPFCEAVSVGYGLQLTVIAIIRIIDYLCAADLYCVGISEHVVGQIVRCGSCLYLRQSVGSVIGIRDACRTADGGICGADVFSGQNRSDATCVIIGVNSSVTVGIDDRKEQTSCGIVKIPCDLSERVSACGKATEYLRSRCDVIGICRYYSHRACSNSTGLCYETVAVIGIGGCGLSRSRALVYGVGFGAVKSGIFFSCFGF